MIRRGKAVGKTAGVLAVVILLLLGFWVWLASRPSGAGPIHDGQRLTVWIDQFRDHWQPQPGNPEDNELTAAAERAIVALGTNAIPTLLAMVATRDSALKTRAMSLLRKWPRIGIKLDSAAHQQARASTGFALLGQTAKPAISGLIKLLSDPDKDVRASAAHCLSFFGPEGREAIPHLLKLMNDAGNGYGPILLNAMHALGSIHEEPEVVVPALMEYVTGPRSSWNYRHPALDALARYRERAAHVVPLIMPLLGEPDRQVQRAAERALSWIDPNGTLQRNHKPGDR